ncbi:hypothetical protein P171DRAFT_465421 [Karstenula rhodostoma CBS 690.94]|uniref:Uncharacterized protein n=1 Tax=Karstenula rhodostoma CBS 690.94 TaxID=1392251 RepID=A0A9P4UA02_9PLEO|nr:hypothetical protein P171DRAFT_465421 [Karstenula rhodostoma CBS 690.94]
MASKLCCTVEQEGHPDSPELPNARVNEAPTPARLPLLPKPVGSANSRFTSARTEDLHELRQIFESAKDNEPARGSPTKAAGRARFNRPSIYSLHSLHKMKSMRSLIRRNFSRDLAKKPSGDQMLSKNGKEDAAPDQDTVVKQQKSGPNVQIKITKDDLRRDLLSDKRPEEGGYDSDAQVLDDIARNIGKKTPNKRPSIHSIEWTPSTASKPTLDSSSKSRQSSDRARDFQPYHIKLTQSVSLTTRLGQVFSSPNLQADTSKAQERKVRRSHSATSIRLPEHSPLSPLRLPSLGSHDPGGIPWSVALNESLQLSHLPVLRRPVTPKRSQVSLKTMLSDKKSTTRLQTQEKKIPKEPPAEDEEDVPTPATVVQIRVQEPTAMTSPRHSGSLRVITRGISSAVAQESAKEQDMIEEDQPRRSVHLYSMRISHHLRSGSLLSWETLADGSELPSPTSPFRDRSFSDLSRTSHSRRQPGRHERQTSSSGFASSRVPPKWGKVLTNDLQEDESSIYSSRPQSPPDSPLESFGGSMINLSQSRKHPISTARSSLELVRVKRSNSCPTDNDETPKPPQKHGLTNLRDVTSYSALTRRSNETSRLARGNSVASTGKSKFREEFSPSPQKKKLIPSASIIRFFTPKRNSSRSQSEANMKPGDLIPDVDGSLQVPDAATHGERRNSKSAISLEAERNALGKDKEASAMWDRALQNYQDEKAAMLLPQNKDLATHTSPFRERSGSVLRARVSEESEMARKLSIPKRFSAPLLDPPSPGAVEFKDPPSIFTRRTALFGTDPATLDPNQETQLRFAQQTDTTDTVGAWGRYPSHTRDDRTLSADHQDRVETRDFALEAAINFAMNKNAEGDDAEEDVDPTTRPATPPLLPGQKERKKKVGHTRMAKSHSMTFGKSFLKNYAKIFRSQSIEFHRHGQGHRSSIATGGTLEYPELEIVPDVWRRAIIEEGSQGSSRETGEAHGAQEEYGPGDKKGKGKMKEEDSAATLRPLPTSSRPTTSNLLQAGLDGTKDTARVWSAYYENCLPSFPHASHELDFSIDDFGAPARRSLESRRPSMHSRTMPVRHSKHSRNASRMSHLSIASHGSGRPSFTSMGENDGGIDERSIVSVRRSTMDLISMYKEQENTEMERALNMMRTESMKESTTSKGL